MYTTHIQGRKLHAFFGNQTHDPIKETDADLQLELVSYGDRRSHIEFCHYF